MAEPKKSNKERLREITEGIEQGIKELFESEKYMKYLSTMSRFHRYSVNNTMLIYMQKPDATLVAGFNKWRDQFERHVKKGEHGITIIAPTPFKKKIEEQKLNPDTKAPMLDADGKVITEEKEIQIPMFKPVKVFDVSQTDGKPLPQLASNLTGDVQQFDAFMEALRRSAPVPLTFEKMDASMDGYFSPDDQRIAIREGMSEVQTVSATVHEIAHSKLHNYEKEQAAAVAGDETREPPKKKDRHTEEVEAESISYAVCQYYGIQTGENSFGYIASWSQGKELAELRASLETINKTASGLITDIDRHFAEICKERGIDPHALEAAEMTVQEQRIEPEPEKPKQRYMAHANPRATGEQDRYYIQAYDSTPGGPIAAEILGFHTKEMCVEVAEQLNSGVISRDEALKRLEGDLTPDISSQTVESPVQQEEGAESVETPPTSMLPDAPEQALDEYPMPDESLGMADLEACGYLDGDMLPLSKERAMELYDMDLTVYAIVGGGSAEMLLDREDFETQAPGTVFALSREEWEECPLFHDKIMERHDHQQEREAAFLAHEGDCFAIYQVKHDDAQRDIRYEGLDWLKSIGRKVEHENYDLVYTAPLPAADSTDAALDALWYQFNNEHPADYQHPSMSVSDIVAVKRDGAVSCHYCDSFGFQAIPGFLPQDNPLRNAEMSMEDDYGMIDGIINNGPKEPTVAQLEQQARSGQPISLMDLAAAAHREDREKKKSVMEQLKSQPKTEHKKTAPKKSSEREI
ncbi:MAG: YodL domain-containing protein [Lachnospiraceae bacterium]|nr:YodL domain-containing protein [Lachnospiraceae bacterium]